MTERVHEYVDGRKDRGRPCLRWSDGVEKARSARLLELRDAKVKHMARK